MSPPPPPPPKGLPVPNPTLPFWRTELHPLDSHRSTPDLPTQCEVLIVGAGFSGASVAWRLLCDYDDDDDDDDDGDKKEMDVVMVEARNCCEGATGRNGGHIKPNAYRNTPRYRQLYGIDAAAEIAALEVAHVPALKKLIEKEKIDCDFHVTRSYDVILDDALAVEAENSYNELARTGHAPLDTVEFTKGKAAERWIVFNAEFLKSIVANDSTVAVYY